MRTLVPHVVTALRVSARLAAADLRSAGAGEALDRLDTGVILVDAAAKILFANHTAAAILARNDVLGIDRDGACTRDHGTTRLLRRLIASCGKEAVVNRRSGGSIEARSSAGRDPLRVVVAPFRAEAVPIVTTWLGTAQPVAMLIVADPEREQRVRKEDLRRQFALSPAEADVALEVLKDDGREACAARLDVTATTIGTHLSHIFEKTGVRRQAELVRLFMRSRRSPPAADGDLKSSARRKGRSRSAASTKID